MFLVLGVVVGYVLASLVIPYFLDQDTRTERLYERFRRMTWEVNRNFRPKGYRVYGELGDPNDSHVNAVPSGWYGNGNTYGTAVSLALEQNASNTTQVSLAYVDETDSFAIVVHMVFTTRRLGRKTVAFPVAERARGPDVFPPDWHLVCSRDNVLFFFQIVPAGEGRESGALEQYPVEWVTKGLSFIDGLRRFLDERNL
ncbi:MAG: hypothetical protein IMW97_06615 [Firmicutes bacterium]|nr:hypothetical protein [Candidatus Fermentithermobacillaceae bacterium]